MYPLRLMQPAPWSLKSKLCSNHPCPITRKPIVSASIDRPSLLPTWCALAPFQFSQQAPYAPFEHCRETLARAWYLPTQSAALALASAAPTLIHSQKLLEYLP